MLVIIIGIILFILAIMGLLLWHSERSSTAKTEFGKWMFLISIVVLIAMIIMAYLKIIPIS